MLLVNMANFAFEYGIGACEYGKRCLSIWQMMPVNMANVAFEYGTCCTLNLADVACKYGKLRLLIPQTLP